MLLRPSNNIKFHYGGSHYIVRGIHSDNSSTGEELIKSIGNVIEIEKETNKSLFELDNNFNWITIGAPSSNHIASQILGHDVSDVTKSKFIPEGLRFLYEYEDELVELKRHTAGGEIQEKAKKVIIRDLKNNNAFGPDEGGWLEEDYLLVTRVFDSKYKKHRTVVGGTHGLGTRGFEIMLNQFPFSNRQKEKLSNSYSGCFQVFARVESSVKEGIRYPSNVIIEEVHIW